MIVLDAIAAELAVESLTVAEEAAARDAAWVDAVPARFPAASLDQIPHDAFKRRTARARAVVRTGECTPYANVILEAGVTLEWVSEKEASGQSDPMQLVMAMGIQASSVWSQHSSSLLGPRSRPRHATVRSATQRRGRTWKPTRLGVAPGSPASAGVA